MPSLPKISLKPPLNLLSRSQIRSRTAAPHASAVSDPRAAEILLRWLQRTRA